MGGQQVVDPAGHLEPPGVQHDQVVGDPLQLGQHVRGEDHRQAGLGHRRHEQAQELVPGQRVQAGQWLVQEQQPRPLGQREGQGELGLLAAGQGAHPGPERYPQPPEALGDLGAVPALVQAPGQAQGGRHGQVLVERRVLGHEAGPGQGRGRAGGQAVQHPDLAGRGPGPADGQVQQRGLAGPVGADERGHVAGGHGQVALAQRPDPAVAPAQPLGDQPQGDEPLGDQGGHATAPRRST